MEWEGGQKYYDFSLFSDFPMANKPAGLTQLKYYKDFLESFTQTPYLESEASTSALFFADKTFFHNALFE